MRLLILSLFLIVQILGSKTCNAQGVGTFQWTNGAPNNNPGLSGAKFAVDKNTYRWYEHVSGTTWIASGDRIQRITGCSEPNYTPSIHNSNVVINGCDDPEIYIWNGSEWKQPAGGGDGSVSLPSRQIGFGTGSGITSDDSLTYVSKTLRLNGGSADGGITGSENLYALQVQMGDAPGYGLSVLKEDKPWLHVNTSGIGFVGDGTDIPFTSIEADPSFSRELRCHVVPVSELSYVWAKATGSNTNSLFLRGHEDIVLQAGTSNATTDRNKRVLIQGSAGTVFNNFGIGSNNNATIINQSEGGTLYQFNASGTFKNKFAAGGASYITGGNFGLGTTSPVAPFTLQETNDGIEFYPNLSGESYLLSYNRSASTWRDLNIRSNNFRIQTNGSDHLFSSAGNLVLGATTDPNNQRLSVNGNTVIGGNAQTGVAALSVSQVGGTGNYLAFAKLNFGSGTNGEQNISANANVVNGTSNTWNPGENTTTRLAKIGLSSIDDKFSYYTTAAKTANFSESDWVKVFEMDNTGINVIGNIKASGEVIPGRWTTATRPTPVANTNPIGFNTTTGKHEGWDGTTWNEFYEIGNIIKASTTLDFPSTPVHENSDLTVTVTGAAVGDVVTVAPALAAISAHSCYTAWVSAANTVTVRFNHYGAGGATDPASGVFNIIVTKF